MNHKLAILPHKVSPVAPKPPARGSERNPSFRAFSDILREAEAVQDHVELRSHTGETAGGGFAGAVRGAVSLLLGPVPGMQGRGGVGRPRRAPGERDGADGA